MARWTFYETIIFYNYRKILPLWLIVQCNSESPVSSHTPWVNLFSGQTSIFYAEGQRLGLIPAWGNAPGSWYRIGQGLKARPIVGVDDRDRAGLQPLTVLDGNFLGRCPRLG